MCRRLCAVVVFIIIGIAYPIGCSHGDDEADGDSPDDAGNPATVELRPGEEGGPPIFDVMAARRSVRSFADTPLTEDELARILWAAQGITDPLRGYRAVPSAGALYPITLYVCDPIRIRRAGRAESGRVGPVGRGRRTRRYRHRSGTCRYRL
jgi:hypothetical protein